MFDARPVVIPLVAGPRDEGPTSPCPDAPGAGCVCAKASPVASAMTQADARMIVFMGTLLHVALLQQPGCSGDVPADGGATASTLCRQTSGFPPALSADIE